MGTTGAVTQDEPRTWITVAIAAAAVTTMLVLATLDHEGPGWMLQPAFGLAAAVLGLRAGGTSPRRTPQRSSSWRSAS